VIVLTRERPASTVEAPSPKRRVRKGYLLPNVKKGPYATAVVLSGMSITTAFVRGKLCCEVLLYNANYQFVCSKERVVLLIRSRPLHPTASGPSNTSPILWGLSCGELQTNFN
jgi:hypothetical protein